MGNFPTQRSSGKKTACNNKTVSEDKPTRIAKYVPSAPAIALALLLASAAPAGACPVRDPAVATGAPAPVATAAAATPGLRLTAAGSAAEETAPAAPSEALAPGGSAQPSNPGPGGNANDIRLGNKALVGSALAFIVLLGSILYGVLTRPKDQ